MRISFQGNAFTNAVRSCRELIEGNLSPTRAAFAIDHIQLRIGPERGIVATDSPKVVSVVSTNGRAMYEWKLATECIDCDLGLLDSHGCVYINPKDAKAVGRLPNLKSIDLVLHAGGMRFEAVRAKGKETCEIRLTPLSGELLYPGVDRFHPGYNPDGMLLGSVKDLSDAFQATSTRSLDFGSDTRPMLHFRKNLSASIEAIGKGSADFPTEHVTDFLAWVDQYRPARLSFWEQSNIIRLDTTDTTETEPGYACCWFVRNHP